jgi:hypothetical protein
MVIWGNVEVKGATPRNTHFPFILSYFFSRKKTDNGDDMFGADSDMDISSTLFLWAHMYILFAIELEGLV